MEAVQETISPKEIGEITEKSVKSKELTGSEALLEALVIEGVDTIFGYPGGAIMPIYDALFDYGDKLNHILVRHEQGGIHAGLHLIPSLLLRHVPRPEDHDPFMTVAPILVVPTLQVGYPEHPRQT